MNTFVLIRIQKGLSPQVVETITTDKTVHELLASQGKSIKNRLPNDRWILDGSTEFDEHQLHLSPKNRTL